MRYFIPTLTIILLCLLLAGCSSSDETDQVAALNAKLNDYRAEHWGPPNLLGQIDYFGGSYNFYDEERERGENTEVEGIWDPATSPFLGDLRGTLSPNISVPFTRFPSPVATALNAYFDTEDPVLREIDPILDGGLAYLTEEQLQASEFPTAPWPEFLAYQIYAKTAVLRGRLAIARGNPIEATEWFGRAVRLGGSMACGDILIKELIGIASVQIGLAGYKSLVWSDAPEAAVAESRRQLASSAHIADRMKQTVRMAQVTDSFALQNWRYSFAGDPRALFTNQAALLWQLTQSIEDYPLEEIAWLISEEKTPEAFAHLCYLRERAHALDVSMLPAFAKRLRAELRVYDGEIPGVPVLTGPGFAELPDLLQLRLLFGGHDMQTVMGRTQIAREKYRHMYFAMAAAEHYKKTGEDVRDLIELALGDPFLTPEGEWGRLRLMRIDDMDFWMGRIVDRVTPTRQYSSQGQANPVSFSGPTASNTEQPHDNWLDRQYWLHGIPQNDVDWWLQGVGGMTALVAEVRQPEMTDSSENRYRNLSVILREDLAPLVIVSPGPLGEPPTNPPTLYDPTNGTFSAGSIMTPVHF